MQLGSILDRLLLLSHLLAFRHDIPLHTCTKTYNYIYWLQRIWFRFLNLMACAPCDVSDNPKPVARATLRCSQASPFSRGTMHRPQRNETGRSEFTTDVVIQSRRLR